MQKISMFDFHPTHSPQYTGSQSETGMVLMEVELVSGEETFAHSFIFIVGWEAKFSEIESLVDDANFQIQRVERCNQNSILLHQKT